MNQHSILVAVIAILVLESGIISAQKTEELRPKRSFSWPSLPSFFGGSSAAPAAEAAPIVEDVPQVLVENKAQVPQYIGQYPDASVIGPIISQGKLVNNQLHYPIWRVHKYNGLHLQPLPISLVHDANGVPTGSVTNAVEPVEEDLSTQVTSTPIDTWLSPELIKMAKEFGVTDFKNFPSLKDAMDTLGTTTREDTIEAIKEFAATEDGRNLIRQFIASGGSIAPQDDNEVAASENQEVIAESAENAPSANAAGLGGFLQNLNQPFPGNLVAQLAQLSARPAQSEQQQEADDSEAVETTTSANIFGRISQWTSFLNPFTNRQEIPIPPSGTIVNERNSLPQYLNDEHIANQNTVPLPTLPELPSLPSVPGAEQPPPPLPTIHIPARYIGPRIPFTNGVPPQAGGPYVRVKLPLAGFNPTPQYNIDPKYLHYGRTQLEQQRVSQAPYVFANLDGRNTFQVGTPVLVNSQTSNLQLSQNPSHAAQSTELLSLPTLGASSFSQSEATSGSVSQSVKPVAQPVPVINQTPKIHLTQAPAASVVNEPPLEIDIRSKQPIVSAVPVSSSAQAQAQIRLPNTSKIRLVQSPFAASTFARPIHVREPTYVARNLQLPSNNVLRPFRVPAVPQQALHIGQLPVVPTAGYEVIQTGPNVISSYGQPYDYIYYTDSQGANARQASTNAHVNRDYELRPDASDVVEKTENAIIDAPKSANVSNNDEDPQVNEIENEEKLSIARSNSNDKTTADADHNDDGDHDQSSVSTSDDKTKAESDSKDMDNDEQIEQTDVTATETGVVATAAAVTAETDKPTAEGTIYSNLRPRMKKIKTSTEMKSMHIQRIMPPNSRNNKIYHADLKAVEMMPYTLRHMAESNAQTEDVQK